MFIIKVLDYDLSSNEILKWKCKLYIWRRYLMIHITNNKCQECINNSYILVRKNNLFKSHSGVLFITQNGLSVAT